ncbi:hypothetical protein F0562_026311 [Nyssa sinensis]|uniref:WIYLD domain-containing protein n=1 Tax=Nyssa sinensis TaxID=561372 RepID=A0A5J5BAE4_9ASTE|nr:hypothetical protein F0562_026311 [Nyssa sinensis]
MAPRGRYRKPRITRMDAAIDAMIPFGFSEEIVRRTVKDLLKEYGGDEGWPFLEGDAYNLLIETILDEQDKCEQEERKQEKCAEDENLLKITSTSTTLLENQLQTMKGTNQKDSEKIIWDQMRSPSGNPLGVSGLQNRTLPKLIVWLILFVSVTYVVYTLKLILSSRACEGFTVSVDRGLDCDLRVLVVE